MNDASPAPDANIAEAAAFLRGRGFDGRFDCAMVLGTGLGNLADDLEDPVSVAYAETPHFPLTAVSGHPGRLIAGKIERKRVLLLQGRAHYYETGDAAAMKIPLGVIAALSVVTTMAAGIAGAAPSHAETKQKAAGAGAGLRRLIRAFVSRIDDV